ncbi:MAG: histidine phosphatase family protein [Candidatus Omnitrophica bacterium]|nr:histidine phosphatase family protein [Candidatus Omnitrophota bacterium]
MLTRLVLIRHGLTLWNKKGRYCGCKDVALSRQGRLQAKRLSQKLRRVKFDRIYSSDKSRALQTARIIFKQAKINRVSGLGEIDFGVLEGLRHKEVMQKYADVYKQWIADPYHHRIPGSESMPAFKKRVYAAIKKIIKLNAGKNLAIVSHGGVIGVLVSSILKKRNFWNYIPKATSMTVVEYKKGIFKIQGRFSTQS